MIRSVVAAAAIALAGLAQAAAAAEAIDGLWRSPPRDSGAWITVRIQPCEGAPDQRCGVVTAAHDGANQEVVGERVLSGLEQQPDGSWAEGRIIRPIEGEVYNARLRLAGNDVIEVEGCMLAGLTCRDQRWTRIE